MLKKTGIFCIAIMVFISFLGSINCARKKPEKFEEKLSQMIDKISDSLSLTQDQKQKTAKIKDEILKKSREIKDPGKEIEEAFTKQIKSDKFNEAELNKIIDSSNAIREEMLRFMISELAKFHAILTPEQRIKLAGILKEIGIGPERGPGPESE